MCCQVFSSLPKKLIKKECKGRRGRRRSGGGEMRSRGMSSSARSFLFELFFLGDDKLSSVLSKLSFLCLWALSAHMLQDRWRTLHIRAAVAIQTCWRASSNSDPSSLEIQAATAFPAAHYPSLPAQRYPPLPQG